MREPPSALLVYEHITGGGLPADAPLPLWWREAEAVARAVCGLFREWGRLPVITTRDARLGDAEGLADEVHVVGPGAGLVALPALARRCGAALVVAPETDGVLERASALVQQADALLLGSPPAAVAAAADKWGLLRRLRAAEIAAPDTRLVAAPGAREAAEALGYPVVVKPRRGAACEGVSLAGDAAALDAAVARLRPPDRGRFLVQRYLEGQAASVSLLAGTAGAVALSLNTQAVTLGSASRYSGGVAGVYHGLREEAFLLARDAVAQVPGLRGLVGVDVVLGAGGCSFLELNPRVTTPVLGLREALGLDLADALWSACTAGELPAVPVPVRRPVPFSAEGDDAI